MAMKKKKGDEPVRVGVGKAQTVKGFVRDPYGYTSSSNPYRNTRDKQMQKDVKQAVSEGKKKYGTKFVVDVSMDGVIRTKAGASKKAQKAQSARMTAQAKKKK